MIKDNLTVMDELKKYASPKARLTRILQSGNLLQVRRGLYIDSQKNDYSVKTLANIIYGPSYISFEYALAFYGFIPERVSNITSATYGKNKNKIFDTPLGRFLYYYLNPNVYPYAVEIKKEGVHSFLIASPEKALCDMLYKVKGVDAATPGLLENLMFDDLRIDPEKVKSLDLKMISFLAPFYKKRIHIILTDYLKDF